MGRPKLTTAQWVEAATTTHGRLYDYSAAVFLGYGKPITIGCPTHGSFSQGEHNHRNGAGCPKCGTASRVEKRRMTFAQFELRASQLHEGFYTYTPAEISGNQTKVIITCPVHGEFSQRVDVHLRGQGCKQCGYQRNGHQSQLGMSEFLRRAVEAHGDTYEYISGLSGMHRNVSIKCRKHGVFRQTPHAHLRGAGCPRCANAVSKGESELADFVRSLGVVVLANNRNVIAPYELDMYIPGHAVAIEYNGLWFHRDEVVGGKTRKKWELCRDAGVTLIQVFEDEWKNLRPQVEGRIRAALGKCSTVGARKCIVGNVPKKVASTFLKTHHTQGAKTATNMAYGLFHEGELVALATFGKARFNNSGYELLRYCSIGRVAGGISKLVTAFRRDHPGVDIVSYADLRWGSGDSYGKAGFTLDSITEPDYWWADCAKVERISRYKLQAHKTGMSEKDYAQKHKLHRVSGVGHKKWVIVG
jgi:hypothetical protein